MSDKNWICPCNGCKKARKQALQEIQDLIDKWSPDAHLTLHEIVLKVRSELETKKK